MTVSPHEDLKELEYGTFTFVKVLGEGGFGVVCLMQNKLGRKRAIKVMHRKLLQNPEAVRRFLQEAKTAAKIDHPNIVWVEDATTLPDGRPIIVMEYLKGDTLAVRLRQEKRFSGDEAESILLDICSALTAAHDAGVVHRDLKPENVLFHKPAGQAATLKVLDFGIAKVDDDAVHRSTRTGEVLGTVQYMSPEQLLGKTVDLRTDVYALGMLTFELLTGAAAFAVTTATQWVAAHINDQPRRLEGLRPQLKHRASWQQLIDIALAKRACERFPNMAEFADAVRAANDGLAIVGPPQAPVPQKTITSAAKLKRPTLLITPVSKKASAPVSSEVQHSVPPVLAPEATTAVPQKRHSAQQAAGPSENTAVPVPVALPPSAQTEVPFGSAPDVDEDDELSPDGDKHHDNVTVPPQTLHLSTPPKRKLQSIVVALGGLALVVALVVAMRGRSSEPVTQPNAVLPVDATARVATGGDMDAAIARSREFDAHQARPVDAGAPDARPMHAVVDAAEAKPVLRRPRGKGTVAFLITPWATVYVDGKKRGSAPIRLTLSAGWHRIKLVSGKRMERLKIYVRANKGITVKRSW